MTRNPPAVITGPATRTVARVVLVVVGVLVGLGVVALAIDVSQASFAGREEVVVLLSLDSEFNIPTVASVLGLAACALLLFLLGATQRTRGGPHTRRWTVLGGIFLYLAVDEGARIHERLNGPMSALPVTTGYLRWGWVVVGALLVVVLTVTYWKFVLALPARQRIGVIVAATLYVGGALFLEAVGARIAGLYGVNSGVYLALTVAEETMELAGIGVLLVVLWSLLRHWNTTVVASTAPAFASGPGHARDGASRR